MRLTLALALLFALGGPVGSLALADGGHHYGEHHQQDAYHDRGFHEDRRDGWGNDGNYEDKDATFYRRYHEYDDD